MVNHKRKICVVTGSRAEYGLLFWLMKEIQADPDLQLQLLVTGSHLSPEFGLTYQDIERDGFRIDEKVDLQLSTISALQVAQSTGIAVSGCASVFTKLRPDIVVLLGDRYEILAAALAATFVKIPIAHIHGGETSEGAFDEAFRHAITKMAHWHFVAAEPYRKRVLQLGEQPECVLNVGAPGLDYLRRTQLLTRDELQKAMEFQFADINFLVTYHPTTLSSRNLEEGVTHFLTALDAFSTAHMIMTKSNADPSGIVINNAFEAYAKARSNRVIAVSSLGQRKYLSAMSVCDVVIGNSSSGIIEAPALKKPTVNIGDRQRGRLQASSIIDCGEGSAEIIAAIQKALSPEFRSQLAATISLYGESDASKCMKEKLKNVSLDNVLMKKFYDLSC